MAARPLARALALLGTALMCVAAAVAIDAPARAAASAVQWKACHGGYFCTKVHVPLDYRDPNGPQISIAMVKQPATDPAHRIGSIFLNPGGPGGSGIDFVLGAGHDLFTPRVRARFDLIGFDPRGILASTQLRCFQTLDQAVSHFPQFPYPDNAKRRQQTFAGDRYLEDACAHRGNPILDHMATADAARDLDRLRQAVGDRQLSYYGVSYGSFLGNTYANLFPGRVRAVVIDGVLNPVAWTGRGANGALPFSTRLHSDVGAMTTLREFFRLCNAGGSNCPFAPHAASKFWQLYYRLQKHPLHMQGMSVPYDQSFLMSDTLGAMYDSSGWLDFARYLKQLRAKAGPKTLAQQRARLRPGYSQYQNFVEGFPGVACSDSINPHSTARLDEGCRERAAPGRPVRPDLDVGVERVRTLARPRQQPLSRPVQPLHRAPGARGRQPVRPGHAVPRRADRRAAAAQLAAAHAEGVGPHVPVPLDLRDEQDLALPADLAGAGEGDGVRPGRHPVQEVDDELNSTARAHAAVEPRALPDLVAKRRGSQPTGVTRLDHWVERTKRRGDGE